eukprot:TRINITY_DN2708_c0_g1_i1.p1 TRINITY_DN2708_c0_g1~~TRINITY_DN2708_c0_g1_i1.p1  ORF type:complete len:122 (+),score=14.95 TRINITY_DN2708_c0_g1_i1:191-556(+)
MLQLAQHTVFKIPPFDSIKNLVRMSTTPFLTSKCRSLCAPYATFPITHNDASHRFSFVPCKNSTKYGRHSNTACDSSSVPPDILTKHQQATETNSSSFDCSAFCNTSRMFRSNTSSIKSVS